MNIQFKIKKLGAITDSTIEFKPLMIFSGDSSLGKSYTAFLAYYFISLFTNKRLKSFVEKNLPIEELKKAIENENRASFILSIRDLQRWINFNSKQYIGYLIGNPDFDADIDIQFDMIDLKIKLEIEKPIKTNEETLNPSESIKVTVGDEIYNAGISFLNDIPELLHQVLNLYFLKALFKRNSKYHTIFLPPSRAALVGANISAMNEIMSSAGMYKEFLNDMELLNSATEEKYHPSKNITRLMKDLMGGEVKSEKGLLFYEFDNQKIPITSAASSVKELAPLTMLLKRFNPKSFSVLFEEPEAHTHPRMQVKLANIISQLVNDGAFFQITTHSDYFLNQINNLIRLFKIKKTNEFESFCSLNKLNKNLTLDPKLLGAYFFKKKNDGTVGIQTQDVQNGIPFDTFEGTITDLMSNSSTIEDYLEEIS